MADELLRIQRAKTEGDPWTPADANTIPAYSEPHARVFEKEHTEDGEHLLPAPAATARFSWNGTTYKLEWSEGLDLAYNGGVGFRRDGIGLVSFQLAKPMRSADHWIATAGVDNNEIVGGVEDPTSKNTERSAVQLYNETGTKTDCAFTLVCWGQRA